MNFKNKKYLIFDMDGTLVDSSKLLANSINYVRRALGLDKMDDEVILKAINDESINPAKFFYESDNFEDYHNELFYEYYQTHYKDDLRLYPGAKELLEKLYKTHKLSLATNAHKRSAHTVLFTLGIEHYFDIIICGDDVTYSKPHPQMINMIIDFYQDKKEKFLMIGDSPKDKLCAQNAGIDFVLVKWGFSSFEKEENIISSFDELEELLLK